MGFLDDFSRTRARGAELIRGPKRRSSDAPLGLEAPERGRSSDAPAPHASEARFRADPKRISSERHARPGTPVPKVTGRWNEGRRGQMAYLLIGLVVGAITVALLRTETLRKARISLAKTFLPDDLDVQPVENRPSNGRAVLPPPSTTSALATPVQLPAQAASAAGVEPSAGPVSTTAGSVSTARQKAPQRIPPPRKGPTPLVDPTVQPTMPTLGGSSGGNPMQSMQQLQQMQQVQQLLGGSDTKP